MQNIGQNRRGVGLEHLKIGREYEGRIGKGLAEGPAIMQGTCDYHSVQWVKIWLQSTEIEVDGVAGEGKHLWCFGVCRYGAGAARGLGKRHCALTQAQHGCDQE